MNKKACIKNASVDAQICSKILQCVPSNLGVQKAVKALLNKGLVPRAGIEPARPYLTKPRILSPERKLSNYFKSFMSSVFFVLRRHQKCISSCGNMLQHAPPFIILQSGEDAFPWRSFSLTFNKTSSMFSNFEGRGYGYQEFMVQAL
jgi:hypothetical protein